MQKILLLLNIILCEIILCQNVFGDQNLLSQLGFARKSVHTQKVVQKVIDPSSRILHLNSAFGTTWHAARHFRKFYLFLLSREYKKLIGQLKGVQKIVTPRV